MKINYVKNKVFAFDLDGTLLNDQKEILPSTKKSIQNIIALGGIIVLSSGRLFEGIFPIAKELGLDNFGGYISSFNGGNLVNIKTREVLFNQTLSSKHAHQIQVYLKEEHCSSLTYVQNVIYTEDVKNQYMEVEEKCVHLKVNQVSDIHKYTTIGVNKILGTDDPQKLDTVCKKIQEKFDFIDAYKSCEYFLEILPKGINKAATLKRLLEILHLSKNDLYAFGDGDNDIEMIQFAGNGVAMGNATDMVKKVAKNVTLDNNSHGIQYALDKIIIGEW